MKYFLKTKVQIEKEVGNMSWKGGAENEERSENTPPTLCSVFSALKPHFHAVSTPSQAARKAEMCTSKSLGLLHIPDPSSVWASQNSRVRGSTGTLDMVVTGPKETQICITVLLTNCPALSGTEGGPRIGDFQSWNWDDHKLTRTGGHPNSREVPQR